MRAAQLRLEEAQRPLVLVTGVFDLLHAGHMRLLFQAREKAEHGTLVVGVNSDRWCAEHKRVPVMNFAERVTALGYMPWDKLVEIDTQAELRDLINRLRPDLHVLGTDHLGYESKYPWMRKMFVRSGGMHTTEIIKRVRGLV